MAQGDQTRITIEGLRELVHSFELLEREAVNEDLLGQIATYVIQSMLQRISEGRDVEGNLFEPYSPKYTLFRMSKGRPVDRVRLFYDGTMLSALTHTVYDEKVEIFFMPTYGKSPSGKASKVSSAEKALYLNQNRHFFALSEEEQSTVRSMIQAHLGRLVEGG